MGTRKGSLFGNNNQSNPSPTSHSSVEKSGTLLRLSSGFLSSKVWKKRYCVLSCCKLYYYERETSRGDEKSSGCINLEHYDICAPSESRANKKVGNVFTITSTTGDVGQHVFAAPSAAELAEWLVVIQKALQTVPCRNKKRHSKENKHLSKVLRSEGKKGSSSTPSSPHANRNGKANSMIIMGDESPAQQLISATKNRAKGPRGRRLPQRKSMWPGKMVSLSQGNADFDDSSSPDLRMRAISMSALENDENGDEFWSSNRSIDISQDRSPNHQLVYTYSSSEDSLACMAPPSADFTPPLTTKLQKSELQENLPQTAQEILSEVERKYACAETQVRNNQSDQLAAISSDLSISVPSIRFDCGDSVKSKESLSKVDGACERIANVKCEIQRVQCELSCLQQAVSSIRLKPSNSMSAIPNADLSNLNAFTERINRVLKAVESLFEKAKYLVLEAQEARDKHEELRDRAGLLLTQLEAALSGARHTELIK